jgi:hypothetical protein
MQFDPVHHCNPVLVVREDGTSYLEYDQREVPQSLPDPAPLFAAQWNAVREQRKVLLEATDWRVVRAAESGQPLTQAWKDYRQALRDVTLQANPFTLVWPQLPTEGVQFSDDGHVAQEVL